MAVEVMGDRTDEQTSSCITPCNWHSEGVRDDHVGASHDPAKTKSGIGTLSGFGEHLNFGWLQHKSFPLEFEPGPATLWHTDESWTGELVVVDMAFRDLRHCSRFFRLALGGGVNDEDICFLARLLFRCFADNRWTSFDEFPFPELLKSLSVPRDAVTLGVAERAGDGKNKDFLDFDNWFASLLLEPPSEICNGRLRNCSWAQSVGHPADDSLKKTLTLPMTGEQEVN